MLSTRDIKPIKPCPLWKDSQFSDLMCLFKTVEEDVSKGVHIQGSEPESGDPRALRSLWQAEEKGA